MAKGFGCTSCAIGWNAKSKGADIVPRRVVIAAARGTRIALGVAFEHSGVSLCSSGGAPKKPGAAFTPGSASDCPAMPAPDRTNLSGRVARVKQIADRAAAVIGDAGWTRCQS
jgi:hypothetical protein